MTLARRLSGQARSFTVGELGRVPGRAYGAGQLLAGLSLTASKNSDPRAELAGGRCLAGE